MSELNRISSYNEGGFQIQRLSFLWTDANNQSRSGNLTGWRWTLDAIWRELSRDAVHKTKGFEPESFDDLKDNKWVKGYDKRVKAINEAASIIDERARKVGFYRSLHDMDVFLRILQDKVGKGGKYRDNYEDDL